MQTGNDSAFFCIGLSSIPGVGRVTFRKLVKHFGTPEHALKANRDELINIEGLSEKVVTQIITTSWRGHAEQELAKARDSGVQIITIDNSAYPASLRNIPDPPLYLYVKGSLDQDAGIAVVGTRKPTHYGMTVTHRIARDLAAAGMTIVSGMARGIDTHAHRGALAAKGKTVAVLGCGIDIVYPPENKDLMREIIRSGAVVSENPFGTKPEAGYFPGRNRIISGLSRGTVIIEASEDSGSLITAGYTREQSRLLFAVPGNIGWPSSRGANNLIKQGAVLVESAADILSEIGIKSSLTARQENRTSSLPKLDTNEDAVFGCITNEPKHIDVILNECGTPAGKLSGILITLELKGLVKQLPGKYYVVAV